MLVAVRRTVAGGERLLGRVKLGHRIVQVGGDAVGIVETRGGAEGEGTLRTGTAPDTNMSQHRIVGSVAVVGEKMDLPWWPPARRARTASAAAPPFPTMARGMFTPCALSSHEDRADDRDYADYESPQRRVSEATHVELEPEPMYATHDANQSRSPLMTTVNRPRVATTQPHERA